MTIKQKTTFCIQSEGLDTIFVQPAQDRDCVEQGGCFIKTESQAGEVFIPNGQIIDLIQALTRLARRTGITNAN